MNEGIMFIYFFITKTNLRILSLYITQYPQILFLIIYLQSGIRKLGC